MPLVNIMLGEVIFGGVGAGMYGMLLFIILAVFIAGLMVGRTPEYLGKKIQAYEVRMAMLAVLVFPLTVSCCRASPRCRRSSARRDRQPWPTRSVGDSVCLHVGQREQRVGIRRPECEHAVVQLTLGAAMLIGRFFVIMPMLAIAGSLGRKKSVPPSAGTFPVTTPLFAVLLVGVIVIVGALTFFPALSLGPIVEHLSDGQREGVLMPRYRQTSIWNPRIVRAPRRDALRKLQPRTMARNPVMFVVEVASALTTVALARDVIAGRSGVGFEIQITVLALDHRAVRELRRSHGGRAR